MAPSCKKYCKCIPQRGIIAFMAFSGFVCTYAMRVCISMAIIKMTVPRNETGKLQDNSCPAYDPGVRPNNGTYSGKNPETTETPNLFEWSEYLQGIILSSFYWGYGITQIPGGLVTQKFGIKLVLGMSILCQALLTLLTPTMTFWGDAPVLITARFLLGLLQGFVQPAISGLLAQWIPPNERTSLGCLAYVGTSVGTLVSNALSGKLMTISSTGWPVIFYIYGSVSLLWVILWIFLSSNSPREHPFITQKEQDYLIEKISEDKSETALAIPWKRLLTSKPFLALIIIQMGQDWTIYTVMSDLPKYMNNVLKLPVELTGYAVGLHNVTGITYAFIVSWLSDFLIIKGHLSRTTVRKMNVTIASLGTGLFLIAGIHADCNRLLAVTLITFGLSMKYSSVPGVKVNNLDLSPNYAGLMMGVLNGISSVTGIFAPYAVGVLAPNQTLEEWKLIFWIMFIILLITNVIFVSFGSGEVQKWNNIENCKTISLKEKRSDEKI